MYQACTSGGTTAGTKYRVMIFDMRVLVIGGTGFVGAAEAWVRELAEAAGWRGEIAVLNEPCPAPNLPRQLNLSRHLNMDASKIRRE